MQRIKKKLIQMRFLANNDLFEKKLMYGATTLCNQNKNMFTTFLLHIALHCIKVDFRLCLSRTPSKIMNHSKAVLDSHSFRGNLPHIGN